MTLLNADLTLKKIHVLHVLNSAYGGSAISTFQLIEELKHAGVESSLVCFNNATTKQKEFIRNLVVGRVIFIPLYWTNKRIRVKWWKRPLLELYTLLKTFGGYRFQKEIGSLIKAHSINIVHTSTLVNPEGAIAARRNKIPHVWHARELVGPAAHYHFWNYKRWSAYVLDNTKVLIANSSVTRDNLKQFFPENIIRYIPNGIDITDFSVKDHAVPKLPTVVGMVGNVTSKWKNHEFFIRTAAGFKNDNDVSFRIYGELPHENDPYLIRLKDIIHQFELQERVTFMGHQGNVQRIMTDIDILFHPTGLESFGRIFIEAMAGGVPIVAVNEGGAVELVRNGVNGFRIEEDNCDEAISSLKNLLSSERLRNELGKNGRAIVEKEYTLSLLAQRLHLLYQEVLDDKPLL
jgi:glycosyltransferase involved in cell wall biosynthesis